MLNMTWVHTKTNIKCDVNVNAYKPNIKYVVDAHKTNIKSDVDAYKTQY